ncbi:MAG: hypothetical protein PHV17_00995 [Candidatus Omnitrophica bacterium]|nr:hypothetical protein [Candidatus Omnitrophota bacterium]
MNNFILAAKCEPSKLSLTKVAGSGIKAVELFISPKLLENVGELVRICSDFDMKFAVHAPALGYSPGLLSEFCQQIKAAVIVFHNVYWEDEWTEISQLFKDIKTKVCIENTYSVHEPSKFIRRFGFGSCLDLEHLQMEVCGVFKEAFLPFIAGASHIHLTGYFYGSNLWHNHIHYSPEHNRQILDLIKKSGYCGMIVSEAEVNQQTSADYKRLNDFYNHWLSGF